MKGSKVLFLVILAVVLSLGALNVAAKDNSGSWVVVSEMEITHPMYAASFLNDTVGITVGYAGEIHYTTDGGTSWPRAVNTSMCRFGLDIIDETTAWNVGNGGNVRFSSDGGATWTAVTDLPFKGVSKLVSFIDEQTGWVSNNVALWATADGGQSWQEIELPDGFDSKNSVASLSLLDAATGYLLDIQGYLYTTADGGATWASQPVVLSDERKISTMATPAIRFFDEDNGMMAIRIKKAGFAVLRTEDGGATWAEEALPFEGESGILTITHDGSYLTYMAPNAITVLNYVTE